ncbi:MAG: EVE domain-containing protein [Odoribacter sp.]|nr:EVE domain-containing protein [Odoribacter sp.]
MQTITTYYEKNVCSCHLPVSKEQWAELLRDSELTTPERLETLLAFYYSSNHQNTCVGVAKRFGGLSKSHSANIMWFGRDVLAKIGDIEIRDSDGSITYWPVAMGEGMPVKNGDGAFRWTLRSELVEALREYILQDALNQYSAAFAENWEREDYKWIALKTFQDNWDINADDFAQMLEKSLSDTKNLLVSQSTFPKLMITSYAKQEPKTVREMFRELFDETLDVKERIENFMNSSDALSQRLSPGKMHYQNTNAISTYLWLSYPGKYPIYKWSEIAAVCKKIGIPNPPKANGKPSETVHSYEIKNDMAEVVNQDNNLIATYQAALDTYPNKYFKPDGLATFVDDFGFWISRYYKPIISESTEHKIKKTVANIAAEPSVVFHEPHYWWLVASPKYWSFGDLQVGDTVHYTVKNDKGNKRRVPANFENAKVGDIVIGYEANPVKKIVALAKVVKASDGETITYEKTETLEAPISWFDFKGLDELRDMEFIKNKNGSFFKLTKDEYEVLLDLIRQENPEPDDANPIKQNEDFESYTKERFLTEVFMSEQKLEELIKLIRLKKNVILQGAPGVGKTFSAKRLAYCMMQKKDDNRIEMVQFHQNYSYEDFIMGYRPTADGGFELRTGLFYTFCKKAEAQPDKDFFFIIDEINRGNLSKIFGELLMLIENSYRGQPIKLAYRNELFAVPKNLYIIGMMNTADRSLAMIDYALRRRFSFHPMAPGFDTEGFKTEVAKHSDPRVAKVVDAVKTLNGTIAKDDSLGEGFCIGHSYFCGQPTDTPWIDHVVRYDLCPMLDEYWFDSKEKCDAEKSCLLDMLK